MTTKEYAALLCRPVLPSPAQPSAPQVNWHDRPNFILKYRLFSIGLQLLEQMRSAPGKHWKEDSSRKIYLSQQQITSAHII